MIIKLDRRQLEQFEIFFINKAVKNGIPISSANESEIQRYNACRFDFSGDVFSIKFNCSKEQILPRIF